MTYEDEREAEILQSLWRPDAPLENTLFAILDPYGRPLTRGSRSPGWFFRDASDMAAGMNEIAAQYRPEGEPQRLPVVSTVRLALNVAACDKLPLAIVVADNVSERDQLEQKMAPVAWSAELIGKLTYSGGSLSELRSVRGGSVGRGYIFVAPDQFGTGGTVVGELPASASQAELAAAARRAIAMYQPVYLDPRQHIRMGREAGIHWTTAIPITDPHELQAEQMRGPFQR